jgi:hypothetical protein
MSFLYPGNRERGAGNREWEECEEGDLKESRFAK